MNSFINRFIRDFTHRLARGLLRFLGVLCLAVLLIVGVVWAMNRPRPQWEIDAAIARTPPADWRPPADPYAPKTITQAEMQSIIADVYHVKTSSFVRPDLMHVTFDQGEHDQQGKCQAIANLWSHRSGLNNVQVECWSGDKRLGFGEVKFGQLVNP